MGLSEDEQVTVYYTGLLHFAGCTAESEIDARFFGNEMAARPRMMTVAHGSRLELVATAMRTAHAGSAPLARLAGSHGERCDGTGYHRGSRAADLPAAAWLLAAADCYQAMREPRAHRPALSSQAAADELGREAEAGRLPHEAVQAVLAAAGQPRQPVPRPAGLSERECEVLTLIARGMATKQVARQLGISPKTCDHHIQRLYRKTGLSTRAGATLFALEHGLIGGQVSDLRRRARWGVLPNAGAGVLA